MTAGCELTECNLILIFFPLYMLVSFVSFFYPFEFSTLQRQKFTLVSDS